MGATDRDRAAGGRQRPGAVQARRAGLALRQPYWPAPRLLASDPVQKRLKRAPATARTDDQIPRQLIPAPTVELVERHHRREHPIHRRR